MNPFNLIIGLIISAIIPANAGEENMELFNSQITSMTNSIKVQVELCFFDTGKFVRCSTGNKADPARGETGWNLSPKPEDYQTRYIEKIVVENGVITAYAQNNQKLKGANIILLPIKGEYDSIKWEISDESTCLKAGLCKK